MRLKTFTLSFLLVSAFALQAAAQERSLFSNVGVSVNAGTTGLGATVSTPLAKNFTLRAGFGVVPYTYKYTIDELDVDLSSYDPGLGEYTVRHDIDLKAKMNVPAGHFLLDYNPFKGGLGAFHITAGLYVGSSKLFHVNGQISDIDGIRQALNAFQPGAGDGIDFSDLSVEVGDVKVTVNDNGTADAYIKVNGVRPYFGVGWGNAIPKNRIGFRFDIGAMYHGEPKITSPNVEGDLAKVEGAEGFNKVVSQVKFYPQLAFQLTFRLLKDK